MNPGAAGQGRRSCHRLNVCHCCSPTKKTKKQKKTYLPISLTTSSNSSRLSPCSILKTTSFYFFSKLKTPPIWLASSTPYLHLHLQHPICIFIFNTHFASSSSIPIWHLEHPILHLHLQHPFGIILKHPIVYHQPV
jgi:hypothetical protein